MYIDQDDIDSLEKAFHGAVREYIICMLIFLGLYAFSYGILRALKKRNAYDDLYGGDDEDYIVYRISLWICTLSMAVSVAAVLLIPFSICSNEILLQYPQNYYIQWLNDSLVHSLWNYVFLLSNLCLFILLPFAYFFIESQGFAGFRNGLMTRVYESLALCALVILLVFCFARLLYILLHDELLRSQSLFNIWYYQLPFIYSCVSLFGVMLLLTCTPLGFATLFTVFGEMVAKPKGRRDIEKEYLVLTLEEDSLKRKLKAFVTSKCRSASESRCEINRSLNGRILPSSNGLYYCNPTSNDYINGSTILNGVSAEFLTDQLISLQQEKQRLLQMSRSWLWLKNLKYPLLLLILLFLTGGAVLLVIANTIELLVGFRSLPLGTEKVELGRTSLSSFGALGSLFEAVLIFYLMAASLVGFYSVPFLRRLKPARKQTSMTKIICNCVIFIILTSALPVLARTLGITTFDLLGDYGKMDWLGNFYLVLLYNLIFAVATGMCLVTKFTAKIREELYNRFNEAGAHLRSKNWAKNANGSSMNFLFGNNSNSNGFCRSLSVDSVNQDFSNSVGNTSLLFSSSDGDHVKRE